jgi:hypothetical protein
MLIRTTRVAGIIFNRNDPDAVDELRISATWTLGLCRFTSPCAIAFCNNLDAYSTSAAPLRNRSDVRHALSGGNHLTNPINIFHFKSLDKNSQRLQMGDRGYNKVGFPHQVGTANTKYLPANIGSSGLVLLRFRGNSRSAHLRSGRPSGRDRTDW